MESFARLFVVCLDCACVVFCFIVSLEVSLIDGLNVQQEEAVLYFDGPCMVVAGPGSGKTKVLTTKIAYLILCKNKAPRRIMALTFTNKAAAEMKSRLALLGVNTNGLMVGTFHSCFTKILRLESSYIGYSSNFSILDATDEKSVISDVVRKLSLDAGTYEVSAIAHRISIMKNNLIDCDSYRGNVEYIFEDQSKNIPRFVDIYNEYVRVCKMSNSMDFDDLLVNTYLMLRNNESLREKYQGMFEYILVDEFQDTNIVQYEIIKLMSAKYRNLCVVGDDAQSIYSFRGATLGNMLNFKNDYPDVKVIKLEKNYRSTQNIVSVANSIISQNKCQIDKTTWTSNQAGNKCLVVNSLTDVEEAKVIASLIRSSVNSGQLKYSDIAVLYRTNNQSRVFENQLSSFNIPYKLFGGMSFYESKSVKDLLAYLTVIVNPDNIQAIRRSINEPKRGIGDAIVRKLFNKAEEMGASVWATLQKCNEYFDTKTSNVLVGYVNILKPFIGELATKDAYEIANGVCEKAGIIDALRNSNSIKVQGGCDKVIELLNSIKMFVDDNSNNDKGLRSFMQDLPLSGIFNDGSYGSKNCVNDNAVSIMTVHSAKGLEFDTVYITGLEDNIFPIKGNDSSLEEERRLFYVAVTRAKRQLCLSYSASRSIFGKREVTKKSTFLESIDKELLTTCCGAGKYVNVCDGFQSNTRMHSPYFGGGSVVNVRGKNFVRVAFDVYGEKLIDKNMLYAEVFK